MRIGCFQACTCLFSCYEFAKEAVAATVIKLDEIRRDPEAFQKVCIVGRSVIQGINFCCHTHYCLQLIRVLNVAESFDFYGFCRLPRYFMHPYVSNRFDEYAILDQLEVILCENWHLGVPDEEGQSRDPLVHQYAQEQLKAFLEKMVENDQDFCSEDEVKTGLNNWLTKVLEDNPEDDFDPYCINLQDLSIPLKEIHWLEALTDATFVMIDIGCVPVFLQDWGLFDLSYYSNHAGRFPLYNLIRDWSLDDCIWGAMFVGFLLQFIVAVRCLMQEGLAPEESQDAKWLMAASLAEFLYSLAILQRRDPRLITFLAFSAKSLGLLHFLCASKPSFFTRES